MRIYVLFHHYDDDPALMPNAIAVWDEYLEDSAGLDAWEEEKAKAMDAMGPGTFREAVLEVPDGAVLGLFGTHTIQASVEPVEP